MAKDAPAFDPLRVAGIAIVCLLTILLTAMFYGLRFWKWPWKQWFKDYFGR